MGYVHSSLNNFPRLHVVVNVKHILSQFTCVSYNIFM